MRLRPAVIAFAAPFLLTTLVLAAAAPSPEEQQGVEKALQARVRELLAEKNEAGAAFRRGSYSPRFTEAGAGAWKAVFHRETAGPDRLKVERLLLTLKEGGNVWSIANEEVQETYDTLIRSVPGTEEFRAFESFSIERGGLKITTGPGHVVTSQRDGKVADMWLRAGTLEYTYQPPEAKDQLRHGLILADHEEDFVFMPEEVQILCDPVTCEEVLAKSFQGMRPAERSSVDKELLASIDKSSKETQQDRGRDAFDGFTLPYEPERRRLGMGIKKKRAEHYLYLEADSIEPVEVSFWASTYGTVYQYHAANVAAGAAAVERDRMPDLGRRDYDVDSVEGTVEMGFGSGQTMTGDVTVRLRTLRELRELPFEMARLSAEKKSSREARDPRLTINALQDGQGRELTRVSLGPTSGLVVLPEKVPAGTALTLRMSFENRDCIYKFTPAYYYVARAGWLPFLTPGDMIGSFDLTVKVPERFQTLGVGTKASETKEGGANVTRWTSKTALSFPTIIFGGYKDSAAKLALTKKDGAQIPVMTHIDKDSIGEVGVDAPQKIADQAATSIEFYQRLFGADYPYGKLDLVNDPGEAMSGQGPSSLIFLGSGYDPSVRKGLGQLTPAEIARFQRALVPHEVAHQWWGSLVSSASPRHQWWEEALAEYSAALWMQAASDVQGYLTRVQDWRKEVVETRMLAPVQDAYVEWSDDGAWHASLYAKGPYVFHMMRSIWGDERLFSLFRKLMRENAGKEIVTHDIQKAAESVFGEKLDWFFDQWVRGIGIPEFELKYATKPAEGGSHVVTGEVTQRVLVSRRLQPKKILDGVAFQCVAYLSVTGKSGKEYTKLLDIKDRVTPFTFTVPEKPKDVGFNKSGETLAHDVIVVPGS